MTKSVTLNCRGFILILCLNSTLLGFRIYTTLSRASSSKSKFILLPSLDSSVTKLWNLDEFSCTSTCIIASDQYTKLNGVSFFVDRGVV